jgi:2-(1,2-epoxy-1,2-dihydrophenyl)acetyl-CoA isomerase
MPYSEIRYDASGEVARLTLNRPKALNSLSKKLRAELSEALARAAQEESVRALLFSGEGRAFCVGQDVKELKEGYEAGESLGRLVEDEYVPLVKCLRDLPMPTVALVNGACVGGGMALALAADFRVVTEKSSFTPAFVKVGLAPDSGVTFFLSRAIGQARALSLCLRGQTISPAELVAWGLAAKVNESLEAAQAEADALLAELLAGPTKAYAQIRRLFDEAAGASLEQTMKLEAGAQEELSHTHDHREALAAFLAKRRPEFQGR